jgi:hypothetical protein
VLVDDSGGTITQTNDEPHYSGGIALDRSDPRIVYLSHKVGARWELEQLITRDDGQTWSSTPIDVPGMKNFRPCAPWNLPPNKRAVLFVSGEYSYWDFSTPARGYHTGVHLWLDSAW